MLRLEEVEAVQDFRGEDSELLASVLLEYFEYLVILTDLVDALPVAEAAFDRIDRHEY